MVMPSPLSLLSKTDLASVQSSPVKSKRRPQFTTKRKSIHRQNMPIRLSVIEEDPVSDQEKGSHKSMAFSDVTSKHNQSLNISLLSDKVKISENSLLGENQKEEAAMKHSVNSSIHSSKFESCRENKEIHRTNQSRNTSYANILEDLGD